MKLTTNSSDGYWYDDDALLENSWITRGYIKLILVKTKRLKMFIFPRSQVYHSLSSSSSLYTKLLIVGVSILFISELLLE